LSIADWIADCGLAQLKLRHMRRAGLQSRQSPIHSHVIFVAGDDEGIKSVVKKLIEDIGFGAVDMGTLADGRFQEPGSPIYNRPMSVAEAQQILEGKPRG
jgi:predicted dinucleotide-binding enzyme